MDKKSAQFLEELSHCIDENDAVKGCALMPFFAEMPGPVQHRALKQLFLSMEAPGFPMVRFLCCHLRQQKDEKTLSWIVRRLTTAESFGPEDENRLAFWAKAMGTMGLETAIPGLLSLASATDSAQVVAGALSAILLLDGQDGPRLVRLLCEEEPVRGARIAETLPLSGPEGFLAVAELLTSPHPGLRNLAIDIFSAAGDQGVFALAAHLEIADTDSAIHAISALGRTASPQAVSVLKKRLKKEHDHPNVRYAIFEAAGRLPSSAWALHLARGLSDPAESVRFAAARAVEKNLSSALVTGIANIISFEDETAQNVVGALIDAGVENTLGMLLKTKGFSSLAENHLAQNTPAETREKCLALFDRKGAFALASRERKKASNHKNPPEKAPAIVCVDDSKMMLRLYTKHLSAEGYRPICFENPLDAISALQSSAPLLVITDLNMPKMDGFSLATRIREQWPGLPILMVTTQSEDAPPAGDGKSPVDRLLHKPFRPEELSQAVDALAFAQQAIDF